MERQIRRADESNHGAVDTFRSFLRPDPTAYPISRIFAFTAGRPPTASALLTGTGLIAPTF
jgi:hypothetical protein